MLMRVRSMMAAQRGLSAPVVVGAGDVAAAGVRVRVRPRRVFIARVVAVEVTGCASERFGLCGVHVGGVRCAMCVGNKPNCNSRWLLFNAAGTGSGQCKGGDSGAVYIGRV